MNVSDILFQFTPLREGRQFQPHKLMVASNFNSRPSARGDLVLRSSCRYQSAFQFTPLREGRRCLGHASFALTAISIHAPPRGATFYEGSMHKVYTISIHAPPRGATFCMWYTPSIVVISIHAPPRGATGCRRSGIIVYTIFQFTPLREGRRNIAEM